MNDLQNYKAVLERYFGAGTATFSTAKGADFNNVVGALNHRDFKLPCGCASSKGLERLAARYPNADANRKHLLDTVNEVGSEKNWEGAYAELVAFDFLNSDKDYLSAPISLSENSTCDEYPGRSIGKSKMPILTGSYDDFDVCFDVKVLLDKSRAILDGIIEQVKLNPGISGAAIEPEYHSGFRF